MGEGVFCEPPKVITNKNPDARLLSLIIAKRLDQVEVCMQSSLEDADKVHGMHVKPHASLELAKYIKSLLDIFVRATAPKR